MLFRSTTISKWKNKKVDEFELIIEPGDSFVSLPYTFWENGKKINWEIVGEGKIDTAVNEITESSTNRKTVMKRVYAKLKNGYKHTGQKILLLMMNFGWKM